MHLHLIKHARQSDFIVELDKEYKNYRLCQAIQIKACQALDRKLNFDDKTCKYKNISTLKLGMTENKF